MWHLPSMHWSKACCWEFLPERRVLETCYLLLNNSSTYFHSRNKPQWSWSVPLQFWLSIIVASYDLPMPGSSWLPASHIEAKKGKKVSEFQKCTVACQIKDYAAIPNGAILPVPPNWHLGPLIGFRKQNIVMLGVIYRPMHAQTLSALYITRNIIVGKCLESFLTSGLQWKLATDCPLFGHLNVFILVVKEVFKNEIHKVGHNGNFMAKRVCSVTKFSYKGGQSKWQL